MSKFFGGEEEFDRGVAANHRDSADYPHAAPEDQDGGTSNQAFLADYRNRLPYHYIEQGDDGYYYWNYGETLVLEFTLEDGVAITDPTPEFVTDVRVNGISVTDVSTGIADILLGSMAFCNTEDYPTREEVDGLLLNLEVLLKEAEERTQEAKKKADKMAKDFYAMLGYEPGPGDDYTVLANFPFTIIIPRGAESITVNGERFTELACVDGRHKIGDCDDFDGDDDPETKLPPDHPSEAHKFAMLPIVDAPKEVPLLAVFNPEEEHHLLIGFASLPIDFLDTVIIPAVEQKAKIRTSNLALDEEPIEQLEGKLPETDEERDNLLDAIVEE